MTIILFYIFFSALFTGGFIFRRAEDKIGMAIITSIVLGWLLMPIILGDLVSELSKE